MNQFEKMGIVFGDDKRTDELHRLYWQAVRLAVDGIEGEIVTGEIVSQSEAYQLLCQHLYEHEWTQEPWSIVTLLMSQHASATLANARKMVSSVKSMSGNSIITDGDSFPFEWFAYWPMVMDCRKELEKREAYQKL